MALPETSPLETALTRIIGEPPATPPISPTQLAPRTSVPAAGTSVNLGALQPATPEPPAPVYTPPAPAAPAAAPAPALAPAYSALAPAAPAPAPAALAPAVPQELAPQPYEYAGHGSQDPIARQVMKDYWSTPMWGGSKSTVYDQNVWLADAYDKAGFGGFVSPLNPANWGGAFRGQDYADIADKYRAAGGTYYNQFTPAQQAAGQPAPVAAAKPVPTKPVYPTGRNVPWQAEHQYWKDLEAYTKAGGK
jgi:hypothetical protein